MTRKYRISVGLAAMLAVAMGFVPVIEGAAPAENILLLGCELPYLTSWGWLPMACPLMTAAIILLGEFRERTKALAAVFLTLLSWIGWAEGAFAAVKYLKGIGAVSLEIKRGFLLGFLVNGALAMLIILCTLYKERTSEQ